VAARRHISPQRKLLYYGGGALVLAGFVTFTSLFFTGTDEPASPRDVSGHEFLERTRTSMRSEMTRAIVAFGLIFVGMILVNIGRMGAAGSGLILDPQQARKDVEPWTRAAGGMANDALQEVDLAKQIGEGLGNPKVKVRCRKCQALSDEAAKFCGQCGERL
jgi:hypothetical protein